MSSQLTDQIKVWWKTVSSQDSLGTYQKTIQATWNILRETGKLLWLVLCLGLVLVTWIWTSSKTSSQKFQAWYQSIPEPKSEHVWTQASQLLVSTGRTTGTKVMTQAREQLGLPALEAPSSPTPIAKAVTAAPPSVSSPPPAPSVDSTEASAK
jgi:hypothetical protein